MVSECIIKIKYCGKFKGCIKLLQYQFQALKMMTEYLFSCCCRRVAVMNDRTTLTWQSFQMFSSLLAHLSRRLKWAIAVRFRPSSVNFLHFHLLENAWLDFNQTWQESSLGVGDSKLFKSYVWPPWGPRGRAPKGQNHANFKHLLLQIQKEKWWSYIVCRYLIRWRIKVVSWQFPGWPQ